MMCVKHCTTGSTGLSDQSHPCAVVTSQTHAQQTTTFVGWRGNDAGRNFLVGEGIDNKNIDVPGAKSP